MKNNFPLSWQDFLYLVGSLAPPVSFDHAACQGYVAHACAKVGAVEAAYHLSGLQQKCGRTKYITAARPLLRSLKKTPPMKTSGLVLILMILGGRNCSVFVVNKKKGHTHNICILIKNLLLINAYIIILVCFCDYIYI